jgi:tetratricopeptide (TPR) repeat protein
VNWRVHQRFEKHADAARKARAEGNHAEALRLCDKAIEIVLKQNLPADDLVATVLMMRSDACHKLGNITTKLWPMPRGLSLACALSNGGCSARDFRSIRIADARNGHERRAIPILEAVVGLGQCVEGDALRTSGRLERIGLAYLRVGVHANSVAAFGKAIDLLTREMGKDASCLGGRYLNLGNGYKRMQQFDDAERCYREALRLYQANGVEDPEKLSVALLNIGVACSETGRGEETERYYQQVLEIRIQALGRNHWRVGNTYNNLAGCRRRLRDFAAAKDYARQAIEILETRPESMCNALDTLSRIYEDEGKLEEALAATARAREIQQNRSSPDLSELATLFDREGLLAARSGDEERAAYCRSRAIQARQALASAPPADRDLTSIEESLKTLERHLESSLHHAKALHTT